MRSKGYIFINRWWVSRSKLEAIDALSVGLFTIKRNIVATKLGCWTFYSHKALNPDILDTLRNSFAVPTYKRLL